MSDNYAAHFDVLVAKLQDNNPHSRILSNLVARALLGQLSGEHQLEAAHRVLNVTGIDQLAELEDLPSGTENLSDVRASFREMLWMCALICSYAGHR